MTNIANHKYYATRYKKPCFYPPAMAADLVKALNKVDQRGGWRVIEIDAGYYNKPVRIGRNNRFTIRVTISQPNERRGEASLSIPHKPTHYSDLPQGPTCTFDPMRPIENIAKDILRKIDNQGAEFVEKWEGRVLDEARQAGEVDKLCKRVAAALGKQLLGNGSGTKYFDVGPLRCSIDQNGHFRIERAHPGEAEIMALIDTFRKRNTTCKPVCRSCKSGDRLTVDASAMWSDELGTWEVTNVYDKGGFCEVCNDMDARFDFAEIEGSAA